MACSPQGLVLQGSMISLESLTFLAILKDERSVSVKVQTIKKNKWRYTVWKNVAPTTQFFDCLF